MRSNRVHPVAGGPHCDGRRNEAFSVSVADAEAILDETSNAVPGEKRTRRMTRTIPGLRALPRRHSSPALARPKT